MTKLLALAAALALPFAYAADAPAAAAPAPAAPAVVQPTAKPSCEQPEYPGRLADAGKFEKFNKKYKAYGECMKKFIDEQANLEKASMANANAAINDYNAFVKSVNAQAGN